LFSIFDIIFDLVLNWAAENTKEQNNLCSYLKLFLAYIYNPYIWSL